jgi:peptidylprolyl isomerase
LLPSGIHRIAAGQHFVVTANGQGLFQPSPSIALRTALDKSENMIGAIKRPAKAITESETEASPPAEDVVVKTTTAPIPLIDEDETVEVAAVSAEEAEAEAESETVATKPEPATEALSDLIKAALKGRDPDNFLILDTTKGQVVIEMRPDLAPRHVARIRELVRARFYDRVSFHHVREGFVAETGDPTGKGTGGSGQTLKAEISKQPFEAGVVGTVWGQVKLGLEHIKKLVPGAPPPRPDRILTARLAADLIDKTEEN